MTSQAKDEGSRLLRRSRTDPGSFFYYLTRTLRHWRRELDLELKRYGLTEATCRPLMFLDRLGDGVRQNELAFEIEIEGSSLVRLLDSLQRKGLITRMREAEDRRANNLHLTAAGRAMVGEVRRITDEYHKHVLDALTPAQRATCLAAFEQLEALFVRGRDATATPGDEPRPAARNRRSTATRRRPQRSLRRG